MKYTIISCRIIMRQIKCRTSSSTRPPSIATITPRSRRCYTVNTSSNNTPLRKINRISRFITHSKSISRSRR
nr:hypothetical protein [Cressdnaviricota sp.]